MVSGCLRMVWVVLVGGGWAVVLVDGVRERWMGSLKRGWREGGGA